MSAGIAGWMKWVEGRLDFTQNLAVTNGPSTNAAGTRAFPRTGVAVVNVNVTTTAAHGAGSVLFVLPGGCWPVVEIFATLTDTTGDVPVRVGVRSTTGEVVQQGSIPNGRIIRGSITLPL